MDPCVQCGVKSIAMKIRSNAKAKRIKMDVRKRMSVLRKAMKERTDIYISYITWGGCSGLYKQLRSIKLIIKINYVL